MKAEDRFILDIKRLGINGEGIGFYNRLAVLVPNAIPGEGHQIEITKVENKMAFGKSIEVKRTSKDRVMPVCPYYNDCGGCNTQHISYEKMLVLKRELLIEAIQRYTSLNPRSFEIRQTIPSDEITGYRNRSQLLVKKQGDAFSVGMLKANSNQAVLIDTCSVQKPLINQLNQKILKLADELDIPPYIAKFNRGVLRYLVIRVNEANEALICFICAEKNNKIKELAKKVIQLDHVVSVYESFNFEKKSNSFFDGESQLLEGKPYLIESFGKIKYRIYPSTFFQLNTKQAQKMYDVILKCCKLSRKETVLDAYCGVGTISLYLASMAAKVIGIEYSKESIAAAKENAELNKIKNVEFQQGDAAKLLPKLIEEIQIDCLVVDPPRTGLGEELVECIKNSKIKRIVYASCNVSTLAKDLDKLSQNYQVNSITPIDMFPFTAHVETICQLSLRDETKHIPK